MQITASNLLAPMIRWSGGLAGLMLVGCAAPDPLHARVQGCAAGGHTPGGQGFSQCMSRSPLSSDEERERRRWMARLQREQVEAEARVRRERSVAGLARP